ncbi:hypothetical protein [Methylocystis sp. SB2]|uniref:hypothetical protein n=1 Tax=Methylocystis sp. (strain SB2) TaxID=743836 RepID=UPI001EFBEE12|nr:hypothetical protein [Methylocystis sp. SB2]ULO23741.1 hypothetical protein LNB28_16700 [Methylocystis sp. SB2]
MARVIKQQKQIKRLRSSDGDAASNIASAQILADERPIEGRSSGQPVVGLRCRVDLVVVR